MKNLFSWTMKSRGLSWWVRYLLTMFLVIVTLVIRLHFSEALNAVPFVLFFIPILFSALVFDHGSGLVALVTSAAVIAYFLLKPLHSFEVADQDQRIGLALFVVVNGVLVVLIEALHVAYKDLSRQTETLARSEATLSAVLDALPVGVIIADAGGRILRDNAASRELWGAAPETPNWEAYGEWIGYWPKTGERIKADEWGMARALLRGEVVRDELVQNERFDTGERRFFINNAAPIRNSAGEIVAGVVAELDVTDRLVAEQSLREVEERNRLIIQAARDYAILTTDMAGQITSWSPGATAVFGYSVEEIVGQNFAVLFTPEDRAAGVPEREREMAHREGVAPYAGWRVPKVGEPFWMDGSAWPLHDAQGHETGLLKVGRNRTVQRRAEVLMREAVERQAFLTREVGHRIKNNLTIITSLLHLQARNTRSEEVRSALADARGRIEAIAQVHDHLWRQDQSETVDLDIFLGNLCERVQVTMPLHRITYSGTVSQVTTPIDQAVTLSLLVNELITNAVKYAYPQGEGGPVSVTLRRLENGTLHLEVADRGMGLPAEFAGIGGKEGSLGTKMLRTLARQLDAELQLDGNPGGTRVTLTFPTA